MTSSRRADLSLPSVIYLYDEPSLPNFRVDEIATFLKEKLPNTMITLREEFLSFHASNIEEVARRLASSKVRGIEGVQEKIEPLYGEIQFEKRVLSQPERRITGILYDGFKLQKVFRELIPANELSLHHAHIVFTSRLFCTYEKGDNRYHARVIMCGFPSLISTTGLVEAPAKPREFYLIRQRFHAMGIEPPANELKAAIEGKFIDYDDENLTRALRGYVLQAIFYHTTGNPFCEDKNCVLFNAHWQEEVINAQILSGKLCDMHERVLNEMTGEWYGK